MVAAARCFVQPQYKLPSLMRAILRDEYITWHKKKQDETNPGSQPVDMEGDLLIQMVNKSVSAIMTRLQSQYYINIYQILWGFSSLMLKKSL